MGNEIVNKPPKWDAAGTEPSAELQANGFQAGYKPPAAYFNYLFNRYTACIEEMQRILKEMDIEITEDSLPTVPIKKGGTGATTKEQALTNLGAVPLERVVYGHSTNIKDYAMTLERGFYALHFAGSSYTGTDLPDSNYKYGAAIIYVRIKGDVITIMLLGNDTLPPQFAHCNDGTWGEWSTQFLPITGGKISGNLDFKKVENGSATIYKNHSATADYGLIIRDVKADGGYNQLVLCAEENSIKYRGTDGTAKALYGQHNITYGTTDLEAGVSALLTGHIRLVHE